LTPGVVSLLRGNLVASGAKRTFGELRAQRCINEHTARD